MKDGIRLSIGGLAVAVVLLIQLIAGTIWAGGISSDVANLDARMERFEVKLDALISPDVLAAR